MLAASLKGFVAKYHTTLPSRFEILSQDCDVFIHPEDGRRILANLIDNSIFSLVQRWELENLGQALLKVVVRRDGDMVVVIVEDNGVGMSENIQKDIFTPFFTTKEPGQGTGLGLSMSFELARKYDGRLHFESVAGEYCRFYLELPFYRV